MAKAAAAKTNSVAAGAAPRRRSWFWLQGVVCGGAAVAIPGTALMVAVLLAPGLAMYAAEQGRSRPLARAMILMGAASAFFPLRLLWEQGGSLDTALNLLGDPARPLLSWAASGAGWLVGQATEMATRLALDAAAAKTLRALKEERDQLNAEWHDRPSS